MDEAKEKALSVLDSFETRKAAILHKAFTGELTAKWRAEHGARKDDWLYPVLNDIAAKIFDGPFGSNLKSDDYVSSGIRVVRLENLKNLWFDDSKQSFVSEEKYETIKKHTVYPTDLIMSTFIAEETKVCQMPVYIAYAVNKADCIGIRLRDSVNTRYVLYYLSSKDVFYLLHAMVMSIDDRLPELADFKRMLATGNSRFWKGNYLYVVEQALIADRYYWLYLQYDNANLYAPYVVDITDDAVKDNPRPKNQVEMRNQLFVCYDLRTGSLYVSDYQKKAVITYYLEETLQSPVKAKYVFSSIDEFLCRVTTLKTVSFTQRANLFNYPQDSLLRKVSNIYGLDLPNRSKVKLDYGNTPIGTIRDAMRDWKVKRDAGEFEDVVVVGVDDHGFEEVFNFQTTTLARTCNARNADMTVGSTVPYHGYTFGVNTQLQGVITFRGSFYLTFPFQRRYLQLSSSIVQPK